MLASLVSDVLADSEYPGRPSLEFPRALDVGRSPMQSQGSGGLPTGSSSTVVDGLLV